ncbi:MAG: DNA polymerase IV [Lachnospiraceae bacterium]|nr:DNA polymerase IV [Lachnospiraceae bacterium]
MTRVIFHVDVNSAFLSWTAVRRLEDDPDSQDLRLIPSAVGGDVETRHGVITARSIPAKAYGVKTGEPVVKALQKCPNLVLVPSEFATYRKYSRRFINILKSYTPNVEQASIDEAYMDVTELCLESGSSAFGKAAPEDDPVLANAIALAAGIRERIRTELKFTVNVGISENKLLSKTASDFTKPDRTHVLLPSMIPEKLWPMDINELYGCGRKTAEKLRDSGIFTIGDAAHADPELLRSLLGEKGSEYIHNAANGIDDSEVITESAPAKSYSNEITLPEDLTAANYKEKAPEILGWLCRKVSGRLKKDGITGETVTLIVKTSDFRRFTRQTRLPESTNEAGVLLECSSRLLQQISFGGKNASAPGHLSSGGGYRLVGVGVSTLHDDSFRQVTLTDYMKTAEKENAEKEKRRRIDEALGKVRAKYGADSVKKGLLD